jgi:hypothetical protein
MLGSARSYERRIVARAAAFWITIRLGFAITTALAASLANEPLGDPTRLSLPAIVGVVALTTFLVVVEAGRQRERVMAGNLGTSLGNTANRALVTITLLEIAFSYVMHARS